MFQISQFPADQKQLETNTLTVKRTGRQIKRFNTGTNSFVPINSLQSQEQVKLGHLRRQRNENAVLEVVFQRVIKKKPDYLKFKGIPAR